MFKTTSSNPKRSNRNKFSCGTRWVWSFEAFLNRMHMLPSLIIEYVTGYLPTLHTSTRTSSSCWRCWSKQTRFKDSLIEVGDTVTMWPCDLMFDFALKGILQWLNRYNFLVWNWWPPLSHYKYLTWFTVKTVFVYI